MRRLGAVLIAATLLHACARPPSPAPATTRPLAPAPFPQSPAPSLFPADMPGWQTEDHRAAFQAFLAGCGVAKDSATAEVCRIARQTNKSEAQRFFESYFRVEALPGDGILTAYFAPEYEARDAPTAEFDMPLRPAPADLTPGGGRYATRAEIEARPPGDALAWLRAEDLFFLQVQGSGTLRYPDGRKVKALFAAHNGQTFQGIANPMRDRGLLPGDNTDAGSIRTWLATNRGPEAQKIMALNPRYVFFRLAPDDGSDPAGAAGIPLPAGHAIAVDPSYHDYGALYWIDAAAPILAGAFPVYRRLVMALDTGGAIRGQVRADLYLGKGDAAGQEAGRVRHTLQMYRFVPVIR
jgi:membrane-bound lytic murein transglycosylase A